MWWKYAFHGNSEFPQVPNTTNGISLLRRHAPVWRKHLDSGIRFFHAILLLWKAFLSVPEIEFVSVSFLHTSFFREQSYSSFLGDGQGRDIPEAGKHLCCYT